MTIIMKSVVSTVANLSRTCPKCKKKQVVPRSKSHRTVSCKFCGADIPTEAPVKR